jgi:kynureninase
MRERFARPTEDTVYLDGNSIGAMPADAPERVQRLMSEGWCDARRRGWNRFDWLEKPWLLGEGLAPLIGAGKRDVVFCDNTSVNLYKILAYAWQLDRSRPVIVTEAHNFRPTCTLRKAWPGSPAAARRCGESTSPGTSTPLCEATSACST